MNPQNDELSKYISNICSQLADKAIWQFQRLKVKPFEDDSELENPWDEFCVQVQGGESRYYEHYESNLEQTLNHLFTDVDPHLKTLIWFETEEGGDFLFDWEYEDDEDEKPDLDEHFDEDTVIRYLLNKYIVPKAEEYTNKKIEAYLDRH